MPVEFEDDLGDALRRTADTFRPADPRELVDAGHQAGRRMRRRRTAGAVAGAAAIAAVAVGGVLAGGLAQHDGHTSGVAAAPEQPKPAAKPAAAAVTGEQVAAVFAGLLPHGTVKDLQGSGPADFGFPFASASAVFDDGKGPAEVAVGLQRDGQPLEPCGQVRASGVWCSLTHVHGGTLQIIKGYEYPDHRVETKDWTATFVTPDGSQVQLNQWNSSAEKGAPITRKNPPLDVAQMTAMVTSADWKHLLASLPKPKPYAG
ncbi:hypothetical protein [Actinacidiphila bryophytorum]|uniref:Uncharacterized protein n=1 Tax=Actinacidiphila bryophytorum TaxID=1436133 RepID=A0A9W4MF33_9ACTN|nr:hypothetical protein [Actinacidiphila bryophytorum]MBM9439917.1 hypothetical protein [Actinacidiphila bryophytorum]MBN6546447.1 hypothetical protein [Actinacidiphila bryophytorum]CAG7640832.1 conserved hypothetical protein [Actinacidiphila bryophytorum]